MSYLGVNDVATEFMSVHDAKEAELIPTPFHPYFKEKCDYCGADIAINIARTVMRCSNPRCYRRIGNQADSMLKDLGYKGYGPETLTAYCKNCNIKSITEFIKDPPLPLHIVDDLEERKYSFAKLVELLHLPTVGTKAYKLFGDYTNWHQCLEDIMSKPDPIAFVASRVGGLETANQLIEVLLEYSDELEEITELVTPVAPLGGVVNIAITGHITEVTVNGRGLTKDEYIAQLNRLANRCNAEFRQSGALQSVMYIVADSPSNSRKYKIGAERKVLISSGTLYKMMEDIVERIEGGTHE